MKPELDTLRPALLLAMLTLLFGIGMGVVFGVNEDGVKDYIAAGVAAHPELHDAKSEAKIWRYAQRAHFHATGIGAFTLALVLVTGLTRLTPRLKRLTALLMAGGGLYPLGWLSMFVLAPSMGRDAAHGALATELLVYVGTGALLAGLIILFAHLLTGLGAAAPATDHLEGATA